MNFALDVQSQHFIVLNIDWASVHHALMTIEQQIHI